MPIYTVKNKESEETKDVMCSYDDRKKWLKDNPGWEFILSTPQIISGTSVSGGKLPEGFKVKMREAKKLHPLSKGLDHII